eukprot:gene4443-5453_t
MDMLPAGTGSGFIWDEEGHIVTNFHVLQGACKAQVYLHDGSVFEATLVGQYPNADLAVLKIEPGSTRLSTIAVASSSNLQVGQRCFAIGNPFGLGQSLTGGLVSGLDRDMRAITGSTIRGVVQTDAAVNPGAASSMQLSPMAEALCC